MWTQRRWNINRPCQLLSDHRKLLWKNSIILVYFYIVIYKLSLSYDLLITLQLIYVCIAGSQQSVSGSGLGEYGHTHSTSRADWMLVSYKKIYIYPIIRIVSVTSMIIIHKLDAVFFHRGTDSDTQQYCNKHCIIIHELVHWICLHTHTHTLVRQTKDGQTATYGHTDTHTHTIT